MNTVLNRLNRERGSGEIGVLALIVVVVLVVIALPIYWFGAKASAEPNKTCVVYSGGPFTDKEFQEILEPGTTNKIIGWGSTARCYNNDQRSYIASNKEGADTSPVVVTCRGDDVVEGEESTTDKSTSQISVTFDYNMYFTLNTAEEELETFDREIGRKTKANTDEGWVEMLRDYMEPQVTRAMQDVATKYSCLDLVGDTEIRGKYQAEVVKQFKQNLGSVVKGDYFCAPDYTGSGDCGDISFKVSNPALPEAIRQSIEARITARQATATQRELNNTATEKLKIDDELIKKYGPQGALIYKAIESGTVTFYVLPDGSTVPVPAPQPGG